MTASLSANPIRLHYATSLIVTQLLPTGLLHALVALEVPESTLMVDLLDLRDPVVSQRFERGTGDCVLAFTLTPVAPAEDSKQDADAGQDDGQATAPQHVLYVNVADHSLYLWLKTGNQTVRDFTESLTTLDDDYLRQYFLTLGQHLAPFLAEGTPPTVQNMKYELNLLATQSFNAQTGQAAVAPTPTPTPAPAPTLGQRLAALWRRLVGA